MKKERASPDVKTYNAVMSACERGGQVEEAKKVFAELRQWHKPDVISYSYSYSYSYSATVAILAQETCAA